MISVLLPSRGRPTALRDTITGLRQHADQPDRIEILVAVDPDDPDTSLAAADLNVDHLWPAPSRYGYHQLHRYINALAIQASGDWLMLWNDDARIRTTGWDSIIHQQNPGVLWPHSNDVPGCNTFPIWPRAWTAALGHVSLSPHCDSWIQHLGETLGQQQRIPVGILHDRADLTGGHDDQTRAESANGYRTSDYHSPAMQDARHCDINNLRLYLADTATPQEVAR